MEVVPKGYHRTFMSAESVSPHRQILQLKITLSGRKPAIWRRVLVPADLTLAQFHTVIQISMGWEDRHLHEFRIGRQRFGVPDPDAGIMGDGYMVNEKKVRLREVLAQPGATANYIYDFGDGWEHIIVLEKLPPPESALFLSGMYWR